MNEEQFREQAMELLSNIQSWVKHSDDYRNRLFSNEDITDREALDVIVWMRVQIGKPEQGA